MFVCQHIRGMDGWMDGWAGGQVCSQAERESEDWGNEWVERERGLEMTWKNISKVGCSAKTAC